MIYVVLGMHKSGTTLVSEILHHSGINMGDPPDTDPALGYDEGNKYERAETFRLNNDILDSHDVESINIRIPEPLTAGQKTKREMAELIEGLCSRHDDWGFKDPRLCLTYPLWASLLPEHRLIAIYRSLYELTERYDADRSLPRAYRLVDSWNEHNLRLVSHLETTAMPWILVNYDALMETRDELRRLERFVGCRLTDRRRRALRRGTRQRGLAVRVAEVLYRWRTGRRTEGTLACLRRHAQMSVAGPPEVDET